MQRKEEPEEVTRQRERCLEVIGWLGELDGPREDDEKDQSAVLEEGEEKTKEVGLGVYFDEQLLRVFAPYHRMANMARQWFKDEAERQIVRDAEEKRYLEEKAKKDAAAAEVRRENNRKNAAAQ